jgi:hypothetical protein
MVVKVREALNQIPRMKREQAGELKAQQSQSAYLEKMRQAERQNKINQLREERDRLAGYKSQGSRHYRNRQSNQLVEIAPRLAELDAELANLATN